MSPRAACRLATIGFSQVYDYMPGKVDWLARGLPREGSSAGEPRALDVARNDVVTCVLSDRVSDVRDQVRDSPYGFALVVSDNGILLGRLRRAVLLQGDEQATAEQGMEPGPATIRADTPQAELRERLIRQDLTTAVISDPDGMLMGLVRRADLEEPGER